MYFGDLLPFAGPLLKSLWISTYVTVIAMISGGALGALIYLGKRSSFLPVRFVCIGFIEVIRNTPVLVQLYVVFFALPAVGLNLSPLVAGVVALTFNNAGYCAEIYRAGFESLPRGLTEAADALALKRLQTVWFVCFVPALRNVLPALTNQLILLFLASSVASIIALPELMHTIMEISANTFRTVESITVGAVLYFGVSFGISRLSRHIETSAFKWKVA